jgi:8-oxo-dGTP pyrophosphatase MutT (NUDIX family)
VSLVERLRVALAQPARPSLRGDWEVSDWNGERPDTALTPAAVLVPVVDRAEPTVLLTRRTESLRRHAGQVAFPGGRIDPEDADPIAAALREAHEEVALPPHHVALIGVDVPYETGTGYSVTPVVGLIPPDLPLVPAEAEVAALFEAPLAYLLDPANHQVREAEWQGRSRRYFSIDWDTHHIWGATAAMIVNLSRRVNA